MAAWASLRRHRLRFLLYGLLLGAVVAVATRGHTRSLWHPVWAWLRGEASVADRVAEILQRQPELRHAPNGDLVLVAYKAERELELWIDGRPWRTLPIQGASGGPGPKLRRGDGQVPEGFYVLDALNPNSAFHLSVRVSYPNNEDRTRSRSHGISDPGDDIYIHGSRASVGCLALGDPGIEVLFYLVAQRPLGSVPVLLAPGRTALAVPAGHPQADLYGRLTAAIAALPLTP